MPEPCWLRPSRLSAVKGTPSGDADAVADILELGYSATSALKGHKR